MIGAYVVLTVKDGSQAEFETVAAELVASVNANEPGCELYRLFKIRDSKNQYAFMERYKNQEAVEAHRATEYFKRLGRAIGPLLESPPVITRMDQIA